MELRHYLWQTCRDPSDFKTPYCRFDPIVSTIIGFEIYNGWGTGVATAQVLLAKELADKNIEEEYGCGLRMDLDDCWLDFADEKCYTMFLLRWA